MNCINFFEGENLCDIPWATRKFACSFCKREFRSAQALGGHMNVHRRDRARLRILLPTLSSEKCPQNPNPSSYFSTSSSSSLSSCHSLFSPSLRTLQVSTPSSASSMDENKKPRYDFWPENHFPDLIPRKGMDQGVVDHEAGQIFKGFAQRDDEYFNKIDPEEENNIIRVDLELDLDLDIGLLKDHKEEVDLELRLGHL